MMPGTPASTPAPPEPHHPYPPRFWWTRRLLLAGLVLAVLTAGVRLWWGHLAERRFDKAVSELRARGEPALPQDLTRDPLPAEINAVTYLDQAVAAHQLQPSSPSNSNEWFGNQGAPPYPRLWLEMAAASTEANAAMFPPLRQARQQPEIDWGLRFNTPIAMLTLPMLNTQRALANTVGDAALYKHFTGDDAEALRLIEDVFFQADALNEQPFLISYLVGNGIRSLAIHGLQVIATGLTIEGAAHPSNPGATDPASREQVQAMIRYLLDEQGQLDGLHYAFQGDRIMFLDSVTSSAPETLIIDPAFPLMAVSIMRLYDKALIAGEQMTLPAALTAGPSKQEVEEIRQRHVLAWMHVTTFSRTMVTHFKVRGEQRMIAAALAVRMYHNDHGRYPQALEELVPEYLPYVPVDPFANDGRPIGYILAADGTRPIVYHVGEDGQDNTPDESVLATRPLFGWQDPQRIYGYFRNVPVDQWRDISVWQDPNPPPPASEMEWDFDFDPHEMDQ